MLTSETIRIGERKIGHAHPPFIVAEMSGNHNQSLDRALAIVDAAAKAGAHALKIQTYTADTMTLDVNGSGFQIEDDQSLWAGKSLYTLYQEAHTPWEWHEHIFQRCKEHGMIGFSTPFDETAVDFLESLNVPCYKIASFENVDLPLIRKVCSTAKPVLMSTGMATLQELDEAVSTARTAGCKHLILLKCTSSYPASPEHSNIRTMSHMEEAFSTHIGLSDHTMGIGVAVASVALGAVAIEKHFTLSRADGGVDAAFSLEPEEFSALVRECERAWQSLGKVSYGVTTSETKSLIFRRSLYVSKDLEKGELLDNDSLRIVRPGLGLPPKFRDLVIGRAVSRAVKKGTPITWDLI